MEQFVHLLLSITILMFGLSIVIGMLIPNRTLTAIEHAIWHRVIVGSTGNRLSARKFFKHLVAILAIIFLIALL